MQSRCAKSVRERLKKGDILSEWDFAENYSFFHEVELQSEYWRQKQISLLISLTHYWEGDHVVTEVDVFLSGDKKHDTHYFQHAFRSHAKKYFSKLGPNGTHYIFTDGAPSHFKNRSSISFLIEVYIKLLVFVMWGFNAPGEGKGAWDGIGAVIKCLLRRMEMHDKFPGYRYCQTWADIFVFLAQHFDDIDTLDVSTAQEITVDSKWFGDTKSRINSVVERMNMHYIHVQSELDSDVWSAESEYTKILTNLTTSDILDPISRPVEPPNVSPIKGMKTTWFCFCAVTHDEVAVRRFSCDCQACMNVERNVTHIGKV